MNEDFGSAREFLRFFLEDRRFNSRHIFDATETERNGYIFRGQACGDWSLLPSAFRLGNPLKRFTPQSPSIYDKEKDRKPHLGMHLHAELRSVLLFLEKVDNLPVA